MWWEYFSFKFCPVFHQSALEWSYFDQNWAKTRPFLFKIWKFSNSMDSRIVHCNTDFSIYLLGLCWSNSCIAYICISVSREMSPQTSSSPKWFVAISTRMRLLSSVGQHVIPQITSPTTWFVATHTLVQLLSTVGKHVIFQITSQTEWFASRQFLQSSNQSINQLFIQLNNPLGFSNSWRLSQ